MSIHEIPQFLLHLLLHTSQNLSPKSNRIDNTKSLKHLPVLPIVQPPHPLNPTVLGKTRESRQKGSSASCSARASAQSRLMVPGSRWLSPKAPAPFRSRRRGRRAGIASPASYSAAGLARSAVDAAAPTLRQFARVERVIRWRGPLWRTSRASAASRERSRAGYWSRARFCALAGRARGALEGCACLT